MLSRQIRRKVFRKHAELAHIFDDLDPNNRTNFALYFDIIKVR